MTVKELLSIKMYGDVDYLEMYDQEGNSLIENKRGYYDLDNSDDVLSLIDRYGDLEVVNIGFYIECDIYGKLILNVEM